MLAPQAWGDAGAQRGGMWHGSHHRMAGLSLIEMMIAMVMALIVAAGIISVFVSTSSSNKVQTQMATLQEAGRFAIHSLRSDLANANGGYCSNTGGNAGSTSSGLFLDALRSPTIYATAGPGLYNSIADLTRAYPTPTQAFSLPSTFYMRGYDCPVTGGCTPVDPDTGTVLAGDSAIPAAGTAVGNRVIGTDALTIRYINPGSGWALVPPTDPNGSYMTVAAKDSTVTLRPLPGEQPANTFTGNFMMLADCSNAQVFAVTGAGSGTLTVSDANYAQPLDITQGAAPRVFDFTNDFQTVTYFVQVVDAGNGHTTGELVRRVNGKDYPLVRGVERLDFRYGVIDANGDTRFLTATQVDNGDGGAIPCPPGVALPDTTDNMPGNTPQTGCLWRAVQTIEVHILMDGQVPLYTLTPQELDYVYSPDGNTLAAPDAHAVEPNANQGFPKQLLRREFTTVVALRNFNP